MKAIERELKKASQLISKGEFDKAKALYQKVLANYPKNKSTLKALTAIGQLTANKETQAPSQLVNQILTQHHKGNKETAFNQAIDALEIYPNTTILLNFVGVRCKQKGHLNYNLKLNSDEQNVFNSDT